MFGSKIIKLTLLLLSFYLYNAQSSIVGEFFISETALSWQESKEYCESMDMKLVSVNSEEFDKSMMTTLADATFPGNNIWSSGKEVSEGVWAWDSTGEPFYHTRWFVGQPDDIENLNCAYLASSAMLYWRDANCSAPMYFICEDLNKPGRIY